jgi:amino acid transporter/nucleotide-binding universal stress UspA family protein
MSEKPEGPEQFDVRTELSRDLGLVSALAIGIGTMIAAGIFTLSGLAIGYVGSAAIVAFCLAGAVALLTALSYCEFSSIYPESGAGYLYARKTFAPPVAYIVGWCLLLGYTASCAFYLTSLSAYFNEFVWSSPLKALAGLVALSALTLLNIRGTKESGVFQIAVTAGKVILLLWFIVGAFGHLDVTLLAARFSTDALKIGSTATMVFITFFGFSAIAASAGEVRNPTRTIPRAIFISMGVVTVLYTLVVFAVLAANLDTYTEASMGAAAKRFLGPIGGMVIVAGALFSMISASNASIMAGSRVALSMSHLGHLPRGVGTINLKTETPIIALLVVGLGIGAFSMALPLEELAHFADSVLLVALILVNACLIYHRRKFPRLSRPFRVPLVPVLPALGILANLYLLAQAPHPRPVVLAGASLVVGFIGFLAWKGSQGEESALPGEPSRVAVERRAKVEGEFRVLLPITGTNDVHPLVDLAAAVAGARQGEIIVLRVVAIPEQLSPAIVEARVHREERLLAPARSRALERNIPVTSVVRIGHSVARAILEGARERDSDLIVLPWRPSSATRRLISEVTGDVLDHALHDVILVRLGGGKLPRRLLLPTNGGPHAERAEEYAADIARMQGASLTLCAVLRPTDAAEREESEARRLAAAAERLNETAHLTSVDTRVIRHRSVVGGILELAHDYDGIAVGISRQSLSRRVLFGTIHAHLIRRFTGTVIVVKRHHPVEALVKRVMTG